MLSQNPVANVIRGRLLLVMILFVLLAGAALSGGPPPVAHAATITVNSATHAVADDGVCTLREAITAANSDTASGATPGECPAGSGADTIELGVGLTYTLDVVDNSAWGDTGLPAITSLITINGNGSTIEREELAPDFGILVVQPDAYLILNDVTITGGVAAWGGGIQNLGALTISNSTISGNSASSGGGIYSDSIDPVLFQTILSITGSTISGNSTTGSGGGIYNNSSTLTITGSAIVGNSAGSGGGINNTNGAVAITETSFTGNSATGNGGGIYNIDSITITGSTLSGNSADSSGGIFNQNVTASITNSTFSGNGASTGGGIFNASGAVDLTNVIIANSPSGGDCSGSITSLGHNLDSDDTCGLTDTDDLPGADPLLGPLQNNGGAYEYDLCTLVLDVSCIDGIVRVEATVGTLVPATKNIWGTLQSKVLNLDSTAIPVTDPPATGLEFSGPVPDQGVVAVFATLTTPEDGIICSDFKILDTGPAP